MVAWVKSGLDGLLGVFDLDVIFGDYPLTDKIEAFWRMAMLGFAIYLYGRYLLKRNTGGAWTLFPAGVLLVYAFLIRWLDVNGWEQIERLWPLFLLGPALGLIQWYVFGGWSRFVLVPAVLVTGTGLFATGMNAGSAVLPASEWWPVFPMLLALSMHMGGLTNSRWGRLLLIPGGALLLYSVMFLANSLMGVSYERMWPLFLFGPAVGLLALYALGVKRWYVTVPFAVFAVLGFVFLSVF
ncbi:hypothetical protein [Paenibacillus sp. MBLB4367]|uniref:hypothetical protein n=1 Tax=Paenibacillus sp. MBLB4367 TaxID=3384767 RepID=UPI0039081211